VFLLLALGSCEDLDQEKRAAEPVSCEECILT
jgi:hypothetical protein